jgi:hypothetical protein
MWISRSGASRLRNQRVKIIQRFNAVERLSHDIHGVIPRYVVARLITSPKPISSSVMNPGMRMR